MSRFSTAISAAILAAGCQRIAPPASRFPTAADALSRMKASFSCERGVKGEAKIDHFSEQGRLRGKLLLYASSPDRLRFDVVSPPPFNSVISTLTTSGGHFALADQRERKFYEGPASACNIARLTEVPLEAHALVSILGGRAPILVHQDSELQIEWNDAGYYVVRIPSTRGATEELHLAPTPADWKAPWSSQRIRVLDVRVIQRGIVLYHASMDAHEWTQTAPPLVDPDGLEPPILPSGPPCSVEVPRRIHIEVPESDQDMLFRYDVVRLNPPLQPGVFVQPVPDGVLRTHVDCH
ncbi:MAG TPA: hypothetical protein VJT73_20410 [Polyangiaceae bacterium]|nr:hypothetical protein [Polyangiaceae bacterium]